MISEAIRQELVAMGEYWGGDGRILGWRCVTPQNKKNRYLELISQAPTAVSEATIPV